VICGDCIDILKTYRDDHFNLIITSPPYADARKHQYGGPHPDAYVDWFLPKAAEFFRVLKADGSFILNIKERCVNGQRHPYVVRLVLALMDQRWRWNEEFIWAKTTSMPGYWPTRLRDGWEHLYHFTKSKRIAMYQDAIRVPVAAATAKRMRHLNDNDRKRHNSSTGSGVGRRHDRWLNKKLVLPDNVLRCSPVTINKGHPAAFPPSIPEFFIKLFTKDNDFVLDPFAGSGTTIYTAEHLGRRAVGIDINSDYCKRYNQTSKQHQVVRGGGDTGE
jgi:DNA modification methylase